MEWKKAIVKTIDNNDLYEIPNSWLHIHYYEALNILFRLENSLRVFVYTVLKNSFFEKWADIQIKTVDDQETTISAIAKKRIHQAQDYGYLGYEITSPLMHLNSGEIIRLITSDEYWKRYFHEYFKGRKEIIRNKLDEIGNIRNSLAHFRPIKEDDVELIKQNAKHALIAVEEYLFDMVSTFSIVPTNTKEEWYGKLMALNTESCRISLHQSRSENWIRLQIMFTCKILSTKRYSDTWFSYQILNIITPRLINLFPELAKNITYLFEDIPYTQMPKNLNPDFKKQISLVFNKNILSGNLSKINESLASMLSKITEEENLVANDNLAKGNLIEPLWVSASFQERGEQKWWDIRTESLKCPFKKDDPVEYWGDLGLHYMDFITKTTKYPWMPSDVSKYDWK